MKIWLVDAFTKIPYRGNPATVMLVDQFPEERIARQIAAEVNVPEAAFVKPLSEDRFHIRWFSPKTEVSLCGHATLAAGHVLYQENRVKGDAIYFDSLSGELRVYREGSQLRMDLPLIKTIPVSDQRLLKEKLNLDIIDAEQTEDKQDTLILELADEKTVRSFHVPEDILAQLHFRSVIITTRDASGYDFISRNFLPEASTFEEPVTGSAHCKLAYYWQKRLHKTEFKAYQASARGGELLVYLKGDRVHLIGDAVTVMVGEWLGPLV